MKNIIALLLCLLLGSVCSAQVCTVDPVTGQRTCRPIAKTIHAAAAVTGLAVHKVADAITPNDVALPMQASQPYSSPVSSGWSKSWHKVHGQPVRNGLRRLLGR